MDESREDGNVPQRTRLCLGNCGFYGQSEYNGLCASCSKKAKNKPQQKVKPIPAKPLCRVLCHTDGCKFYGTVEHNGFCTKCHELYRLTSLDTDGPESHHEEKAGIKCRKPKCDFYGLPEKDGFCSACYNNDIERTKQPSPTLSLNLDDLGACCSRDREVEFPTGVCDYDDTRPGRPSSVMDVQHEGLQNTFSNQSSKTRSGRPSSLMDVRHEAPKSQSSRTCRSPITTTAEKCLTPGCQYFGSLNKNGLCSGCYQQTTCMSNASHKCQKPQEEFESGACAVPFEVTCRQRKAYSDRNTDNDVTIPKCYLGNIQDSCPAMQQDVEATCDKKDNSKIIYERASNYGSVLQASRASIKEEIIEQGNLPIEEHRKKILKYIKNHRITCIHGETGCGKSTMVPQYILDHYERMQSRAEDARVETSGYDVNIVITQPRRMAAMSLAHRVASLRKEKVGERVGYHIGGDAKVGSGTRICYVTTGILLQMFTNQPKCFKKYTHIILDEIHERQIDSDLLSLIVKLLSSQPEFPNAKIIIMSATLESKLFSRYFSTGLDARPSRKSTTTTGENDVIFVGAKRFDVQEVYLDDLIHNRKYWDILDGDGLAAVGNAMVKFNSQAPTRNDGDTCSKMKMNCFTFPTDEVELSASAKNDLKFMGEGKPAKFRIKPEMCKGLDNVCVQLIRTLIVPRETILVFLPGVGEIQTLYDELSELERNPDECKCFFKLFALSSRILKEDQMEIAAQVPNDDCAHVILATNIAESSLTLANVRYVIDFGLRRHMIYLPQRKMECLVKTWISQASAQQRKGRTGRVFEGTVIRLYTRYFYEDCMSDFDPPEMQLAALDKLVLQAKQVGCNVAPGMGPSILLSHAISPPRVENVKAAVKILADAGALAGASEDSEMTMMALLVLHLPLDLSLCRLIFYGTIFGCAADVVVMAAALSMSQDVLSMPTRLIMKDTDKFQESLRRSFHTRCVFDDGEYSEPIMMLNMFKMWLTFRINSIIMSSEATGGKNKRVHQDPGQRAWSQFRKHYAVNEQRLIEMENAVVDVASRLSKLLPVNSDAARRLKVLVDAIRTVAPSADIDDRVFSDNKVILKFILTAAFTPQFISGPRQNALLEQIMKDKNFPQEKSVILKPPRSVCRNEQLCAKVLGKMFSDTVVRHSLCGDNTLIVECNQPAHQRRHVVQDVSWSVHAAFQFGEGRDKFPCPGLPKTHGIAWGGQERIQCPDHPCRIHWHYLSRDFWSALEVVEAFPTGWRNPIGFACELRSDVNHYAVAAEVQGTEERDKCRVAGVTILPSDSDGLLAIVSMLTFLSHRFPLTVQVAHDDDKRDYVKSVTVSGHKMPFSDGNPFTLDILHRINNIRREVSAVLSHSLDDGMLPDTDLQPLLRRLITYIQNGVQRKFCHRRTGGANETTLSTFELVEEFMKMLKPQQDLYDSLSDPDSDEELPGAPKLPTEVSKDFNYLEEFKKEDWFPHASSDEFLAQQENEKEVAKSLCPRIKYKDCDKDMSLFDEDFD